jgi:nitrate/nitrite-specific signal transduction histidine kinase
LQARHDITRPGLRGHLLGIAEEMTGPLGFARPSACPGGLDEQVPAEVAAQALHAVREALSNAARYAGASRVDVTVDTGSDLVVVVRGDQQPQPAAACFRYHTE